MPRKSSLTRWSRDDGRYRVLVFARTDSARFRVEHGRTGTRLRSRSAATEEEAIALASAIWLGYQRGAVEAAPAKPETIADLIEALCSDPEHSPKTRKGYRATWRLFAATLGDRPLHYCVDATMRRPYCLSIGSEDTPSEAERGCSPEEQ